MASGGKLVVHASESSERAPRLVQEPEGDALEVSSCPGVWGRFCGCDEAKIAATSFSSCMLRFPRTPVSGWEHLVMEQLLRGWI